MISWRSGGNAYLRWRQMGMPRDRAEQFTYHDQNATRNPNQENVKTRPYLLIGFNTGIDRALWLSGLTSGARQSKLILFIATLGETWSRYCNALLCSELRKNYGKE